MENIEFDEVIKVTPQSVLQILSLLPVEIKKSTHEIRMRINMPLILCGIYGMIFVRKDGTYSSVDYNCSYIITSNDIEKTIGAVCNYSLYSHQSDIINGFVTFGNGHRAGFAGEAITENGKILMLKKITSVNLRIASYAHEFPKILTSVFHEFQGIIIAGEPCSGKTTMLKSIAHELSSKYSYGFQKTVIIDERYELKNCTGINCDVLCGYPKLQGIIHAIRTLSPHIIICDEVTTETEAEKIIEGLYSGVKFVISLHCSSISELMLRPVSKKLINSSFFDHIVMLDKGAQPGKISKIIKTEEIINENYIINSNHCNILCHSIFDNTQGKYTL